MKPKKNTQFIILLVITTLYTFFIWSNSILPSNISGAESEGVRAFINNLLRNIGIDFQLTSHITRKIAHFSEFALLGFLTYVTISKTTINKVKQILLSAGICLSIAIIDECIQIFSPGRACQFKDVCIDFSGVICGILFIIILRFIIYYFIKRTGDKDNGKSCSEK